MGTSSRRRVAQLIAVLTLLSSGTAGADPAGRGALDLAVRDLEADHDRATHALYALQSGGAPAVRAIEAAWPSLSTLAQTRAIEALRVLAGATGEAVEALTEAARSTDPQVRERGFAALRRSGPRGRTGLATLLSDPEVGDRAAFALARMDPDFAITPLLGAIGAEGGPGRAALRDSLGIAVRRSKAPGPKLYAWLRSEPAPASAASAALGLSGIDERRNEVASLVAYAAQGSELDFATSWRLLRSAGGAAPSVPIDRWVATQLTEPEEWMLRSAAVDAVTARGAREHARSSLGDPYPRVRARAATALSGEPDSMLERATLARKDPWPMVRAAAVHSLRAEPVALPVVVAAVDDSMSVVRVAAIEVLTPATHDEGWNRIHGRLRAANEWPSVTAAAIGYVAAHCRTDAAESLFRVVMRASPSNALTEDLNNAARAIEALRTLGTPEAQAVLERLRSTPDVPPTLKMALDRPLGDEARCANPAS